MLSKQEQRVYDHLRNHGYINALSSWKLCGIYRLAAVIHNMKKKGIVIQSSRISLNNAYGEKVNFAEYSLSE